jgi:hypothetical protein
MLILIFKVERSYAMDGRLWERLYREIRSAGKKLPISYRTGRPRPYETDEVLAVWAFASLNDGPISVTRNRLAALSYLAGKRLQTVFCRWGKRGGRERSMETLTVF